MNQSQNPLFNTPKPPARKPTSFAEALLETGGQLASSRPPRQQMEQSLAYNQTYQDQEERFRQEQRLAAQHKEVISTEVFDREKEETKKKINELLAELSKLAAEVGDMALGAKKAISQEIAKPGTYHVSFFEALRRYLINLRKRVSESKNWMALSAQRKNQRNHFWGNVKKSGTKYMLSQERTASTQGA